jgi:hypothetical protein
VVCRERGRQNLDRDLTLQLRVGRPIHLAHPAFADLRGDVVNADAGTWTEGQMWRDYTGGTAASVRLLVSNAVVAFDSRSAHRNTLRDYKGTIRSGRFIIFASLGQRRLSRKRLPYGIPAKTTANGSRSWIALSYQSAAASISEQWRW